MLKSKWGVYYISKHGRSKVKTEYVDLACQWSANKIKHPKNHIIFYQSRYNGFFHASLLQNSQTKSLGNATVFLFFKNLYNLIHDNEIISKAEIFNAS